MIGVGVGGMVIGVGVGGMTIGVGVNGIEIGVGVGCGVAVGCGVGCAIGCTVAVSGGGLLQATAATVSATAPGIRSRLPLSLLIRSQNKPLNPAFRCPEFNRSGHLPSVRRRDGNGLHGERGRARLI